MSKGSAGVIGAGIYGVTAALELRALGVDVTLYEQRSDILRGTTANNFFRLHRGYHYPRHLPTARQACQGFGPFMAMFAEALAPPVPHYYAIAATGSQTTAEEFLEHCIRCRLPAKPVALPELLAGSIQGCFEVEEYFYDPDLLRDRAWNLLNRFGVSVERNWHSPAAVPERHDITVVTAYDALNEVMEQLGAPRTALQYETCEVAIIEAPRLPPVSLVVMDGPFFSVAPYQGLHLLYDVEHSVHARTCGVRGPGDMEEATHFRAMLASARRFLQYGPLLDVEYVGSLWADRVVMPHVDATDARRSHMTWVTPEVLSVLSGKVTASVTTGRKVAAEVARRMSLPEPEPALEVS